MKPLKPLTIGVTLLSLLFLTSCGKDDASPGKTLKAKTANFVKYELSSETHEYEENKNAFVEYSTSSSISPQGSWSNYGYGLIDVNELLYFQVEMGKVTYPGSVIYYNEFLDYFTTGHYEYGIDDQHKGVSMIFIDHLGDYWYTDSVSNQKGYFEITDTTSYLSEDWTMRKKLRVEFECQVARTKAGTVKTVFKGEAVVEMEE